MKIKHITDIQEAFRMLPRREKDKIKKLIQVCGHTSKDDVDYMPSTFVECGIARGFTFDHKVFQQFVDHWRINGFMQNM